MTDGQMSFAEWINHSTERNYADCATLKGESAPEAARKVAGLKEKVEVSQALKDSFGYCAAALDGIDDQKVPGETHCTDGQRTLSNLNHIALLMMMHDDDQEEMQEAGTVDSPAVAPLLGLADKLGRVPGKRCRVVRGEAGLTLELLSEQHWG